MGLNLSSACTLPSSPLRLLTQGSTQQSQAKDAICLLGAHEQWVVSLPGESVAVDRIETLSSGELDGLGH